MGAGALAAIVQTGYTLLLAHGRQDRCLLADIWRLVGTALALLTCLPFGIPAYLAGMAALHTVSLVAVLFWLHRDGAVTLPALADAFVPPLAGVVAALISVGVVQIFVPLTGGLIVPSAVTALTFAFVLGVVLRLAYRRELTELVGYLPEQRRLTRWLRLQEAA